jgi:ABC-type lipoprotein release transport system permease subunit
MPLLILAWRNVWRNRRRSLITAASVVVAVFFVVLVEALNQGVTGYLIDNEIRMYTAHIEINRPGYERQVGKAMTDLHEVERVLQDMPRVTAFTRRLEMLALASHGEMSCPAILWGIEPDVQAAFFSYDGMVSRGEAEPGAVVLAGGLAEVLGAAPGDSIVLVGQSYRGRLSAAIFPVSGIADIPIPDLNDHMVFAPIALIQELADVPDGATSLLVSLRDKEQAAAVRDELTARMDTTRFRARTWTEMMGGRLGTYDLRAAGVLILKGVLYLIMGFGILSTIMLTNNERRREYGMLMALGMKRRKLAGVLTAEMLAITLMGALAGVAVTVPVVSLLHHRPIRLGGELGEIMARFNVEPLLVLSNDPEIFVHAALLVGAMTLALSLAGMGRVVGMNVVEALRGGGRP